MSRDDPKPCYVYLICSEIDGQLVGPCKVGISDRPEKRLKQVQTGSPRKLVIGFAFRLFSRRFAQVVEGAFHAGHAEHRMQGEWFDLSAKDTLRGLVDVMKMGLDWVLEKNDDPSITFDGLAEASNLMDAAKLLYSIYESNGELLTQQPSRGEAIN